MPRRARSPIPLPLVAAPVALALVAGACAEGGAVAGGATTRDSAGVAIVESTAPAWGPAQALALAAEPSLRIGEEEGAPEYQFGRIAAAARLSDGRVAVFDGMASELRFYDSTGTFLARTGGEGGGPGEYQFVSWMRRTAGDSLVLHDVMAQRITVLAPDGTVARTVSLAAAVGPAEPVEGQAGRGRVVLSGLGRFRVLAPFGDGTLLARTEGAPQLGVTTATRDTVTYVRLAVDGSVRDTLARLPGDETQAATSGSGEHMFVMVGPPPFGKSSQVAVDGGGFWFGSADRYALARYDTTGRLIRIVRRPVEPLPVTPEDAEAQQKLELERRGGDGPPELRGRMRQATEERWANAKLPATMPAHGPLLVDATGHLWVRETTRPADRVPRWTVFHPEGRMLGTIAMPEAFRPLEFGDDWVLGVQRDESDVEQLVSYPLIPARLLQ